MKIKHNLQSAIDLVLPKIFGHRKKRAVIKRQQEPNIIEINGKTFVAGLEWINLTQPLHFMAEARKIGKERGMSIVAIREGDIIQAGYVPSNNIYAEKGMYSLVLSIACCLPEKHRRSFAGVFQIPNTKSYFVAAVYDGAVVTMGDSIVEGEVRAAELIQVVSNLYSSEFSVFICPPEVPFSAEMHVTLEELLKPEMLSKDAQLKKLMLGLSPKELAMAGIIGAGALSLAWTFNQKYQAEQEEIRQQQIAEEAKAEALRRQLRDEAITKATLAKPWIERPAFHDALKKCVKQLSGAPLSVAGWVFMNGECSESSVIWRFKRTEGASITDLQVESELNELGRPSIHVPGDEAEFNFTFQSIHPGGNDPVPGMNKMLDSLISYFQVINHGLKVEEVKREPVTDSNGEVIELPWKVYEFNVKTEFTPDFLFDQLSGIGLRLNSITVKLENHKLIWELSGVAYAQI